jgi:hypothetical protein
VRSKRADLRPARRRRFGALMWRDADIEARDLKSNALIATECAIN